MKEHVTRNASSGAYGLGFIGAFIYYISVSTGFLSFMGGLFKSIFWPAVLVYEVLKYIQA